MSKAWRWIVENCKASKIFFVGFGVVCVAGSMGLGYATMYVTSYNEEARQESLSKNVDTEMISKFNNDMLGQLLHDAQSKERMEERYAAALQGKIITGASNAGIKGRTSWRPLPQQADGQEQKMDSTSSQL